MNTASLLMFDWQLTAFMVAQYAWHTYRPLTTTGLADVRSVLTGPTYTIYIVFIIIVSNYVMYVRESSFHIS